MVTTWRRGLGLLPLFLLCWPISAQQQAFTPSNELNRHLPKWLRFSGDYRARLEGFSGGLFRPGNDDLYLLGRVRLNMKIQPKSWLGFQFQAQDARIYGRSQPALPPLAKDSLDLRQAYMEIGGADNKAFGLRIGRQEMVFADQRLIGHVSWLNGARSFDAVRATARGGGVRLDAWASAVVALRDGEFNRHVDGDNFHGLYSSFDKLVPKATLDAFLFWRTAPRRRTEAGAPGKLDFKTPGFRLAGKLPARWDYMMLIAGQTGSLAGDDVRAWAGSWQMGHTLPAKWTPRLSAEYNYATGDRNPRDGVRGTFDILYPTPHDLYGLADQVGWKNLHHARGGFEMKPGKKLRVVANYHSWWRASLEDGLYNAGGALLVSSPGSAAGRHIGQEIDFQAFYSFHSSLQLAGGVAHIFPGVFLRRVSPGASYTSPYLMLGYSF